MSDNLSTGFSPKLSNTYKDISLGEFKDDKKKFQKLVIDRDIYAESEIRDALSFARYTMVYIGGMAHIFGDYHNLYQRLIDLNPIRIKLNEIDEY